MPEQPNVRPATIRNERLASLQGNQALADVYVDVEHPKKSPERARGVVGRKKDALLSICGECLLYQSQCYPKRVFYTPDQHDTFYPAVLPVSVAEV